MNKLFIFALIIMTGCATYSENSGTVSIAVNDGLVLYSYGESNDKLDWLVISSGDKGVHLSSKPVMNNSGNINQAKLMWNGELIELKRGNMTIYDVTKGVAYKLSEGITNEMIMDEINKSGLKYDFAKFKKR